MAQVTAAALQRLRDELAAAFQGGLITEFQWQTDTQRELQETTDGPDVPSVEATKMRYVYIR